MSVVIQFDAEWFEYEQAALLVSSMADEALCSGDYRRAKTLREEAKAYRRGRDVALRRALQGSLKP